MFKQIKTTREFKTIMKNYDVGIYDKDARYVVYSDNDRLWYAFDFKNGKINVKSWHNFQAAKDYSLGMFTDEEYNKVNEKNIEIISIDKGFEQGEIEIAYRIHINREYALSGITLATNTFARRINETEAKKQVLDDFKHEYLFKMQLDQVKSPILKEALLKMQKAYPIRQAELSLNDLSKYNQYEIDEFFQELDDWQDSLQEALYDTIIESYDADMIKNSGDETAIIIYPILCEFFEFEQPEREEDLLLSNSFHENLNRLSEKDWETLKEQTLMYENYQTLKDIDKAIEVYQNALSKVKSSSHKMDIYQINSLMKDILNSNPYEDLNAINFEFPENHDVFEKTDSLINTINQIDDILDTDDIAYSADSTDEERMQ